MLYKRAVIKNDKNDDQIKAISIPFVVDIAKRIIKIVP